MPITDPGVQLEIIHEYIEERGTHRITWIIIWLIVVACLVEVVRVFYCHTAFSLILSGRGDRASGLPRYPKRQGGVPLNPVREILVQPGEFPWVVMYSSIGFWYRAWRREGRRGRGRGGKHAMMELSYAYG